MVLLGNFNITPVGVGEKRWAVRARGGRRHRSQRTELSIARHGHDGRRGIGQVLGGAAQLDRKSWPRICPRLSCFRPGIDYRANHSGMLAAKPAAIEKRLGRKLKK